MITDLLLSSVARSALGLIPYAIGRSDGNVTISLPDYPKRRVLEANSTLYWYQSAKGVMDWIGKNLDLNSYTLTVQLTDNPDQHGQVVP